MVKFGCFSVLKKKKRNRKDKDDKLYPNVDGTAKASEIDESKTSSFIVAVPFGIDRGKAKVMNHESPVKGDAADVAYEGEDEHDENLSLRRDNSDLDFQAHVVGSNEEEEEANPSTNKKVDFYNKVECHSENRADVDLIQSGHVSDPGTGRERFCSSPQLKRTCSNLETSDLLKKIAHVLPPSKSYQSFDELQKLAPEQPGSPMSVMSHRSADRVMLKKHSSSQVLPSRSRKLWWKLFLWSHRNTQMLRPVKPQAVSSIFAYNQQGGYCSDNLEPNSTLQRDNMESPGSFTGKSVNQDNNFDNQSWGGFHGVSGFMPQNQWLAFPTGSPMNRVDEWVKELSTQSPLPDNGCINDEMGTDIPQSPENGRSLERSSSNLIRLPNANVSEEVLHANNVIRSLNSSSTGAHIAGMGLRVVPTLSHFSRLKSVNLSGNSIVHVSGGSLPKGLHTLDLSRNNISTIEGLRELSRLRVLDLSYNRISRIGHGLSNCILVKEVYLAGNKISEVEGLHRLLKLTVLDLSFNKITTTKAIGQLVANYNSLLALNLLGNPIQSNISDEQLKKAVCSLLPKLVYLNKQPINHHKAREVGAERVAKAALGNTTRSSHRKTVKRVAQGGAGSSSGLKSSSSYRQRSTRMRSANQAQEWPVLKMKSPELASPSS